MELLIELFDRKYAVLALSELARRGGAKMVTLVHATGASPGAMRATLDVLQERGWVEPNAGYGHPLRPEYVLTRPGARLARACARLDALLQRIDARGLATRKWSMPVLFAIGRGRARFSEIAGRIETVTDRALSLALVDLAAAELVARRVVDDRPPVPVYRATRGGVLLLRPLAQLG